MLLGFGPTQQKSTVLVYCVLLSVAQPPPRKFGQIRLSDDFLGGQNFPKKVATEIAHDNEKRRVSTQRLQSAKIFEFCVAIDKHMTAPEVARARAGWAVKKKEINGGP